MPCWTKQKSTVDLRGANPELLAAALEAIGFTVYTKGEYARYKLAADRFTDNTSVTIDHAGHVSVHLSGSAKTTTDALTREVKRAYAAQVVQTAARKFGWTLKAEGERKYAAQRRY